jgi:hypothetical protein
LCLASSPVLVEFDPFSDEDLRWIAGVGFIVPLEAEADAAVAAQDAVCVLNGRVPGDVVGGGLSRSAGELGQVAVGGPVSGGNRVDRLIDARPVESRLGTDDAGDRRRPESRRRSCERETSGLDLADAPTRCVGEGLVEFQLGVAEDLLFSLEEPV